VRWIGLRASDQSAVAPVVAMFSSPPVVEANTLTPNLHLGGLAIVEGDSFSATGLPPGRYTIPTISSAW
jgi:hypothetical protein